MTTLSIIACILMALSALTLLTWILVLHRVARIFRTVPRLQAGAAAPIDADGAPTISVVIPAHNEQEVIDACLCSVRGQIDANLEIIVVMDRCTDETEHIVARHAREDERVVAVVNSSCPEDWAGKCYAMHRGALRASGEWILFVDADTTMDARLVRAAQAIARARKLNLISILTSLTFSKRFERVVQPVACMWLLKMFPIDMVNREVDPRPFANGQFILVERDMYMRTRGFEAIRQEIVEDIAFARLVREHGGRGGIVLADGMLRSEMYDSFNAFQNGWKRIFIGACKNKPGRLRKYAWRALFAALGVPMLWAATTAVGLALIAQGSILLGGAAIGIALASYAMQLIALGAGFHLGGVPRSTAVNYPAGSLIVAMIMLRAAADLEAGRPVVWGGRQYVLEPR